MCQDPPLAWHSTTTTMRASPAISRLRDGKRQAWAGHPGGVSDTTAPSETTSFQRPRAGAGRPRRPRSQPLLPSNRPRWRHRLTFLMVSHSGQSAGMGGAVDAEGQPGDHADPGARQLVGQLVGGGAPSGVQRRVPTTATQGRSASPWPPGAEQDARTLAPSVKASGYPGWPGQVTSIRLRSQRSHTSPTSTRRAASDDSGADGDGRAFDGRASCPATTSAHACGGG